VNKPLGLSPPGIEFKRAHLYDINPVGVGAMALASLLSVTAHLGLYGELARAFSALIAMVTALAAAPVIAWATKGRYYIARRSGPGAATQCCVICERRYEGPDMAHCPAYQGPICSLCCTLDARCGDLCKPHASLSAQWSAALRWLLPRRAWPYLDTGLGHFLLLMGVIVPLLAALFGLLYRHELSALAGVAATESALRSGFLKAYMALLVIAGLVAWWLVLAHKSQQVAQEESNRQTHLLMQEIESHRQTDEALQQAKLAAEQANQAKSRYISAISHELRTPLNSILGYAQLMGEDASIPPHRKQAVSVIKRGGEHLLSLIEGTLDIARIEAGKLTLDVQPMQFADCVHEMAEMFELQAAAKGLRFGFEVSGNLPELVRADEKRVRQVLINLLGNAIKFTSAGQVTFSVRHAREMAHIDIEDTGPGLSEAELAQIFEPFARGSTAGHSVGGASGAGLGLTIAKMLTNLMGGEMTVVSTPGQGSVFRVRLFLPVAYRDAAGVHGAKARSARRQPKGYEGLRRKLLVVDNEEADRELLVQLLKPMGFELRSAASGHDCLDLLAAGYRPDVIFMDLAMAGIDGWETLRRVRHAGHAGIQLAIVSANAFDKGLDNDVGIRPENFIVKPVRHTELLDWLERSLGLRWCYDGLAPGTATISAPHVMPDALELAGLLEVVNLGFYRGILNKLADIETQQPATAAFVQEMRLLARQFRFEAMASQITQKKAGHAR
ncbi:MAG: ATP-binding protein, partial [Polaromonas sp.]